MSVAIQEQVFIKKKHELAGLLKRVQEGSVQAVDLIVATMNNTDPEKGVSLKTRLECAKLLLEIEIKVSAEISRDQIVRQIAEIKANGLPPPAGSTPGGRPAPKLDFSKVHKVAGYEEA